LPNKKRSTNILIEQVKHLIKSRINHPNKIFVLKLTVDGWVGGVTSYEDSKLTIHKLIWHPLSKKIDPNKPSVDIEVLQASLLELVKKHDLIGYDVAFSLASSIADLKMLTVPFDLSAKVDQKEFFGNSKDKAFWQEFDADILDLKSPLFSYQYAGPAEDDGNSLIYATWADQRAINICIEFLLSAQLYPILIVPETQAIYNHLFSQLDRLEKESFFGILHLASGRSQLMVIGPERLVHAKLNISELDEVLLEDIEKIDEIEGPFWDEVGARLGNALKQAFLYLKEEEGIPPIRNIYVVSESAKDDNAILLLSRNFNLSNLKSYPGSKSIGQMIPVAERNNIKNTSIFSGVLGLGLQEALKKNMLSNKDSDPLNFIRLNLQPNIQRIINNRKLAKLTKIFYLVTATMVTLALIWMVIYLLPVYIINQTQLQDYQIVDKALTNQEQEINAIQMKSKQYDEYIAGLLNTKKGASKSRLMTLLPKIVPAGVELDSFTVTPTSISITGRATSTATAQAFYNAIADNELATNLGMVVDRETPLSLITRFKIAGKPFKVELVGP